MNRIFLILNWRCRTSKIINFRNIILYIKTNSDIMFKKYKSGIIQELLDIFYTPC